VVARNPNKAGEMLGNEMDQQRSRAKSKPDARSLQLPILRVPASISC
jgi:hypothetical protein